MRQKHIYTLALGVLLALGVGGCGGAASAQTSVPTAIPGAPPVVAFDSTSSDLGKVQFNKVYEQTFRVTNQGGLPLVLGKVDLKAVEGC